MGTQNVWGIYASKVLHVVIAVDLMRPVYLTEMFVELCLETALNRVRMGRFESHWSQAY